MTTKKLLIYILSAFIVIILALFGVSYITNYKPPTDIDPGGGSKPLTQEELNELLEKLKNQQPSSSSRSTTAPPAAQPPTAEDFKKYNSQTTAK